MDIPGIMLGYSGWRPGCAAGSAGLVVDTRYGIPVVSHGGSMFGYKSQMIFLPDHGVGAVILTNSDGKCYLSGLFGRRLLEMLFDGKLGTARSPRARTTTGRFRSSPSIQRSTASPSSSASGTEAVARHPR